MCGSSLAALTMMAVTIRSSANGSGYCTSAALPVIGYQPSRELTGAAESRAHGLQRQVTFPVPEDVDPGLAAGVGSDVQGNHRHRQGSGCDCTWSPSPRLDRTRPPLLPIRELRSDQRHIRFLLRRLQGSSRAMERRRHRGLSSSVTQEEPRPAAPKRARSLEYYTTRFGPYPHRFLQFIEQPGNFLGMGVDGSGVVTGGEGIFLLNPPENGLDVMFEVTAS